MKPIVKSAVKHNLVNIMAEKYAIDDESVVDILKATAFKTSGTPATNEQIYALMVVANQYGLNPFLREIYAFPDKKGGIIPVVGVDGWNRIANDHAQFDGVEFTYSDEIVQPTGSGTHCPAWIETRLHRKDRAKPTVIREYLDECYRAPFKDTRTGYTNAGPWQSHPKRMLRHKSLIQCYRVGFAMGGIYDEDEAGRILEAENGVSMKVVPMPVKGSKAIEALEPPEDEAIVVDFDQPKVDSFVAKLEQRARAANQWQAARDLAQERLHGNAARYAVQRLKVAENGRPDANEPDITLVEPVSPEPVTAELVDDDQTDSMI
jgi:phage recombination protein Bet